MIEDVDPIAERIRTLGGVTIAAPSQIVATTAVAEPPADVLEPRAQIEQLIHAGEVVIGRIAAASASRKHTETPARPTFSPAPSCAPARRSSGSSRATSARAAWRSDAQIVPGAFWRWAPRVSCAGLLSPLRRCLPRRASACSIAVLKDRTRRTSRSVVAPYFERLRERRFTLRH